MKSLALILALTISGLAHASGAVDYTCAGYEPNAAPGGELSKQSVVFTMIGANDGVTLHIVSKSSDQVDPKNADLTVDGSCQFTMDPDRKLPAYDVSVKGKCGTQVHQNFKGVCFFDN